ncbi:MAG: tRNA (N6-threonylcarbamoyladenosine(37)-N6)-methyltransferase TrmO [Dehalococcoidia bacterium]|jgi:tRNA-Thr(GGU) m(6)t(6)A37 methyltransferase TsaA
MPENSPEGNTAPEMRLRQVGIVKSPIKEPNLIARAGDLENRSRITRARNDREVISELVIDNDFSGIVDGTEGFSHLLVLYWAHRVASEGRSLVKGHPMGRKDLPLVGIFATRSPARPNPVCATVVRLLERKGNILKVQGLDAVDGSPVIDIKCYLPYYEAIGEVKLSGWMEQINREFADGSITGSDCGEKQ